MTMEARTQLDFSSVYSEHAPYVRRMLVRRRVRAADIDDVLQEVFVTVHRQLPGFEGRARIETWLHSVTWRVVANYHRRERARVAIDESFRSETVEEDDASGFGGRLQRALFGEVDAQQRDLLALHDIGGLAVSDLSSLTGNARATIRQRLERGRAALGRHLWKALTDHDQDALLDRHAPWFEKQRVELPLPHPIICDGNAISALGDTVMVVWRGTSSVRAHEELISLMIATAEANPGTFRFLSVIEPTATLPCREARQLNAWVAAKLGPSTKAAAWVAEGSMLTTIVAPIMNTCFFLAGVPVNPRFFNATAPAISWLSKDGSSDPAQLAAHLAFMRKRLDEEAGTAGRQSP